MKRTTKLISLRAAGALALALSLGVGAGMALAGNRRERPPQGSETWVSPDFDSPGVVGMPMRHAWRVLGDAGYDVMLIGTGKVVLQELGFEGQLLRLEGDTGEGLRYCDASSARCVTVRR